MPVDSTSLGDYLRQERERQQVSLHDISAATKIQLRFLEALETDAYESLPPSPFVVGFLRAYAQYLSLDVASIITAYRAAQSPVSADPAPALVALPTSRSSAARTRLGVLGITAVLVVFVFVLAQPWRHHVSEQSFDIVSGERERLPGHGDTALPLPPPAPTPVGASADKVAASPVPSLRPVPPVAEEPKVAVGEKRATTKAEVPSPVIPTPTSPFAPDTVPAPTASTTSPPLTHSERLILRAEATSETWLRVKIDGEKSQELLLGTGKSISWEASERFLLTVGNVRGTRLTLNGQEVKLAASRNNVIRDLVVTRETPH